MHQKSLADLATAQYSVPAYFPSRSDCQVSSSCLSSSFMIASQSWSSWLLLLKRLGCTPAQQILQIQSSSAPEKFINRLDISCIIVIVIVIVIVIKSGCVEVYQPTVYFLYYHHPHRHRQLTIFCDMIIVIVIVDIIIIVDIFIIITWSIIVVNQQVWFCWYLTVSQLFCVNLINQDVFISIWSSLRCQPKFVGLTLISLHQQEF